MSEVLGLSVFSNIDESLAMKPDGERIRNLSFILPAGVPGLTTSGQECAQTRHSETGRQHTDRQANGQAYRQERQGGEKEREREREGERARDRQTGRQAGRQTERRRDRQTERQTNVQADRQTDRQDIATSPCHCPGLGATSHQGDSLCLEAQGSKGERRVVEALKFGLG